METHTRTVDERNWSVAAHLSGLSGYLIPFGWVIGPLVVWLFKKEEMPFVDDQGKEAVNFQMVVAVIGMGFWLIPWAGEYLLRLLLFLDVGISLYAATQANQGKRFRYHF